MTKPAHVGGTEFARYTVISLSDTEAEMRMKIDGESMDIRCRKK